MDNPIEKRLDLFRNFIQKSNLELKTYQLDGVEWCLKNELGLHYNPDKNLDSDKDYESVRGGIIADEMGLGKTIIMIGLCVANVMRKTLIVLPVILLEQWQSQIYKTTGHKAVIYHGTNKKKIDLATLEKSVIVLTSYQTVVIRRNKKEEKDKKEDLNLLHKVRWNRLIFDEAHHLRNNQTKLFSDCYSINSRIRWLVTGTPIQNREEDFFSLCAILRLPMEHKLKNNNYLKTRFILRRTKKEIGLPMPKLDYHLEKVNWSNINELAFAESLHSSFGFSKMNIGEKSSDLSNERNREVDEIYKYMTQLTYSFSKVKRGELLRLLVASKKTCVLPKLLKPALDDLVSNGDVESYDHCIISSTSKMNSVVSNIISKRENGNGKLVFCHYHLEMMYLYQKLNGEGLKVIIYAKMPKNMEYNGPVLGKKHNLNELDFDVVIIQIQTGCEGLNLQKYSEVYFVSPHWNPMVEEQAVARCHRIGQMKPVSVSHFVMDDFERSSSLDNYIMDTQERKKLLIREAGFL